MDRQKNRKIFDWEKHHQSFIEQWEEMHDNVDENNEPHIESSDDEDTTYDQSTRAGRQVEAGLILDRVLSQLPYFSTLSCIPIHYALEVSILVNATFEP